MAEAYIVDAVRTAGGRKGGALKDWHPADMAARVLDALVERSGIDPAAAAPMTPPGTTQCACMTVARFFCATRRALNQPDSIASGATAMADARRRTSACIPSA